MPGKRERQSGSSARSPRSRISGNDQVLFIGQMPCQHGDQPAVLVGIGIGGKALPVLALLQRPDEGVRRLGIALQPLMDRVVIGVEDLEAALQPRLRLGEDREIMMVLDIVVAVEMPKKMVEARREPAREIRRRQPALAIVANAAGQHAAEFAEHVVPLQATYSPCRGCWHGPATSRADIFRPASANHPAVQPVQAVENRRHRPCRSPLVTDM